MQLVDKSTEEIKQRLLFAHYDLVEDSERIQKIVESKHCKKYFREFAQGSHPGMD
jgi:hypothetical protein